MVHSYLSTYMYEIENQYSLHSLNILEMLAPRARTELCKKAFKYATSNSRNNHQKDLKLTELISLGEFKSLFKSKIMSSLDVLVL